MRFACKDTPRVAAFFLLAFVTLAFSKGWLGGSAIMGSIDAGRYYLGAEGSFTEVGRWVYVFVLAHESLAWVLGLYTLLTGLICKHRRLEGLE